jgi:hypothetical protein
MVSTFELSYSGNEFEENSDGSEEEEDEAEEEEGKPGIVMFSLPYTRTEVSKLPLSNSESKVSDVAVLIFDKVKSSLPSLAQKLCDLYTM